MLSTSKAAAAKDDKLITTFSTPVTNVGAVKAAVALMVKLSIPSPPTMISAAPIVALVPVIVSTPGPPVYASPAARAFNVYEAAVAEVAVV